MLDVPKRARYDRRVERNDERALDAATDVLAEVGWGGLTLLAVAKRADFSKRASSDRFGDREGIGAGLWQTRLGAVAQDAWNVLLRAAGLSGAPGSLDAFTAALRRFAEPDAQLRCIGELLVVAHFHPRVRAAIDADFGADVRHFCTPSASVTPTQAAQRALATALAFGFLLTAARRRYAPLPDPSAFYEVLQRPTAPAALPDVHTFTPRRPFDFGTGEERLEALLNAALEVMSEVGFDGATTLALVRHAGYSEGTLFARYPSKAALFLDAITRLQAASVPEIAALTAPLAERFGPGIADAATTRAALSPERWRGRHLALEYERLAATHPQIQEHARAETLRMIDALDAPPGTYPRAAIEASVHRSFAFGVGVALLPGLLPGVDALPLDVVMVPLRQG